MDHFLSVWIKVCRCTVNVPFFIRMSIFRLLVFSDLSSNILYITAQMDALDGLYSIYFVQSWVVPRDAED